MILISRCLIGEKVRYDGRSQLDDRLRQLLDDNKAIAACPELLGGLAVPREPAEIVGGDGQAVWQGNAKVMTLSGKDVTAAFKQGAQKTLELCLQHDITCVVLKENSPSCGSGWIYDGQFTGIKIEGMGVTTALLAQYGIKVINEKDPLLEGHCID